jgi:hypothetical protein
MRLPRSLAALLVALSLTACSAPAPAPETPQAAASTPAPVASRAPAPQPPKTAPAPDAPAPVEHAGNASPMSPDRTCRTDADCAVKDVGSCCGTFPLCVNKDAKVDPAAVRAQCAKDGMASTCGFQPVSGCTCTKGRCENVAGGAEIM